MIDDQSPPGAWKQHFAKMPNGEQSYQIVLPWPPATVRDHESGVKVWRWTQEEVAFLKEAYQAYLQSDALALLAERMGRTKTSVCSKAYELGITDAKAAKKRAADKVGAARAGKPLGWDHPKGMKGKKHSEATKETLRQSSLKYRATLTKDQAAAIATKAMKTTVERHGKVAPNVKRGTWKAGWREIGGKRCYFRSRWEANYARYLEFLKANGSIQEWQHEPETFWFDAIKRGVRSYLPDFRVWENDGSTVLHEVKGWMDARSKTTLRRMAKYHPDQTIIVVREKQYREIALKVGGLIDGWEASVK